jgi:cysteinyl-tRNA synthetase
MEDLNKAFAKKMMRIYMKPEDLFRNDELYSEYDSFGIPTKDKFGTEISKSKTKKMQKDWEKQKKLYDSINIGK